MKHPALPLAATLSILLGASTAGASSGTLPALLEGMALRGELSASDLARIRPRSGHPTTSGSDSLCWTVPLIEARAFAHAQGARNLPLPPHSIGYIESDILPLRVHYQSQAQIPAAAITLEAAEKAWQHQVDVLGAYAPYTDIDDAPEHGLYLYLAPTGMGGGAYTEWLSDVPETPRSDCSCRVVVDPENFDEDLEEVVYHEFVHATQMATDCAESISAWENFAVAAEHLRFPESYYFLWGFLPEFQAFPEYPFDYFSQDDWGSQKPSAYYQYGAALFPLYLTERYGDGSAAFLTALWQTFAQDGTMTVLPWEVSNDQGNQPDWFEGTRAMLADKQTTLGEAHADFGVWRVAVENRDDGQHFVRAGEFTSPAIRVMHGASDLPVEAEIATHEYGHAFVRFVPSGLQDGLRATLEAPQLVSFGAELLLLRPGQPIERVPLMFEGTTGTATTESLAQVDEVLLVISQTQDLSHDPDEMDYGAVRAVRYWLESSEAPDAGPVDDAGAEGGADAGTDAEADAEPVETGAERGPMLIESAGGGCDCSTGRGGPGALGVALMLALGLAGWVRRR